MGLGRKQLIVVLVTLSLIISSIIAVRLPQYLAACTWLEGSTGPTLSMGAVGGNTVVLNFIDNSGGESSFEIYRDSVLIDTVPSTTSSGSGSSYTYEDIGLAYNSAYSWVVRAIRGSCEVLISNPVNTITLAARPLAPSLTAINTDKINIVVPSGDSNPNNTEYAVLNVTLDQYVAPSGTRQASESWGTRTTFGGNGGVTDSNLTSDTSYTYKIVARNGNNIKTLFSPGSTIVSGKSSGGGGDDDPPDDDPPPPDDDDPPGGGNDDPPGGGGSTGGNGSPEGSTTSEDQPIDSKDPNLTADPVSEPEDAAPSPSTGLLIAFIFISLLKIIILLMMIDTDRRVTWLDDHR